MDKIQVARLVLAGIEAGSADAVGLFLSDDFVCTGLMPYPVSKQTYLRIIRALISGMPDWRFDPSGWQHLGNRVGVDVRVAASQTAVLPPVLPTLPPVLATGRHVSMPQEHLDFFFRGDKIVRLDLQAASGGGLLGLLAQLGIDAPLAV